MVKIFVNGKTQYLNEAFLICDFENRLKVKTSKKPISSSSFGICIDGNVFDRDIVTFVTPDGEISEGVVLRNYQGITSVVESPKCGKRYSLRQVADTIKCIGTALDPKCEDIYKRYRNCYSPIMSAKFPVRIGRTWYHHKITGDFMIDLVSNKLITDIKLSDFGSSVKKKIPTVLTSGEYGIQFGRFHEFDVVRFKNEHNEDCVGVVMADAYGAYIEYNNEKYSLLTTKCSIIGNTLFDSVTSYINEYAEQKPASQTMVAAQVEPAEIGSENTVDDNKIYEVYTDGSAVANPGPCGYGYIITQDRKPVRKNSMFLGDGTNNIAELTAIRDALLDAFNDEPTEIKIYSDSKYCIDGITKWSKSWRKNGYKNSEGNNIANMELWKDVLHTIDNIKKTAKLSFAWVKGHANNDFNNECDKLAKVAISSCI